MKLMLINKDISLVLYYLLTFLKILDIIKFNNI